MSHLTGGTSEMVELVARAIFESRGVLAWEEAPEGMRADWRREARAAIAAIRDPGKAATLAVAKHFGGDAHVGIWWEGHRAMIDDALANKPPGRHKPPGRRQPSWVKRKLWSK